MLDSAVILYLGEVSGVAKSRRKIVPGGGLWDCWIWQLLYWERSLGLLDPAVILYLGEVSEITGFGHNILPGGGLLGC